MDLTVPIIIYLALCFFAAWAAHEKGHSGAGFFLISFLLSPLIGIPWAIVIGKAKPAEPEGELRVGVSGQLEPTPTIKPCPFCAETIKIEAVVCKHCGRDLPADNSTQIA